MKKIIYLLVTALLFTAGCSKKEKKYIPFSSNNSTGAPLQTDSPATNVTGATLSQIRVTPADQSIAKNTHANYIATAVYSDGTTKNISTESTWTVKSETDKVSTVASKKGRFLGSTATSAGTPAKVSAAFGSISGDANLNVTNAGLTSIQITSVPSLVPGGTAQYVATGIFSDGTRQDISSLVTWSSSATNSVAIDSTTGLGTGGTTAATATITATLITPATFPTVANGGVATTTTQLKNAKIVSITVTGVATLGAGSTTNYVASAIYDDGTSSDITTQATWSLSSSANAVVSDAEGSKGFFTAVNAGSVNVQATYIGVTGSKAVTINSLTVSSVTVSPSTKTIAKGTTTQFTATATYSDGSTADVTKTAVWTSSNTSFGTVDTSSTTGGIARGIAAGAVTITAATGGKSAAATLTVTSATLVSISIGNDINSGTGLPGSSGPFTIAKGTTKQYYAVGIYSDGSKQDITSLVSWNSSSTPQVNVGNSTGSIGLATGLSQGSSTIQASFPDSNGNIVNSNTSTLNISAATLTSIGIGLNAGVAVGATKQYTATGTFSDSTTQDITALVTWLSGTAANATISNAVSDKGLAYGLVAGTSNITATLSNGSNGIATTGGGVITSNTSVLTITATASTTPTPSNSTVSGYNVTVPSGLTTGTTPSGDFTGITYQGNPAEVAGFVSTVNYSGTAGCTNFGSTLLTAMINDDPNKIITNNQISSNVIGTNPDCSAVYILAVTTNASMTVTQLSNHLIEEIGKTVPGGTISNLPVSASSESPTTTFRVVLQATYSSTGSELVGVGVSREADYANNAALLASLLDGTNINPTTSTNLSKTDSFTATADPKVDFVWVVDNSGSMAGEQASVVANASTFFTKLKTKRIDFRLGVIATGSTGTNSCEMTAQNKAWALWGTGWTTSANGATAFSNNVSSVGTSGCGTDETGIFFMERALGVHTGEAATIVPRSGAKLIFVILSDEGDGYTTMANKAGANAPSTTFNTASNTFVTNSYKVYTVSGIHDGSVDNGAIAIGQPGKCSGTGTSADNGNNTDTKYYNLALATGGSSSTICSSDYSAILDNIATQAAGSASIYVLTKTPISSTIVVKKNGTAVTQDATNGWAYNSATKTIVFSGTAYPTAGDTITVDYQYNSSVNVAAGKLSDSNLLAYVSKTAKSDTARGTAAAIALLVGAILAGRIWKNRKHS